MVKDHRGSGHWAVISRAEGGAMPCRSCFQTTTELFANIFQKLWHKKMLLQSDKLGENQPSKACSLLRDQVKPAQKLGLNTKITIGSTFQLLESISCLISGTGNVSLVALVYLPSLIVLEFCPSCALDSDIVTFHTNLLWRWWLWWTCLTCCVMIPSLFLKPNSDSGVKKIQTKKKFEDVMCNCASRRLEGRRRPKRVWQNAPRHGLSQIATLNIHKVSHCKRGLWPDFTVEVSDDKYPKHLLSAHIFFHTFVCEVRGLSRGFHHSARHKWQWTEIKENIQVEWWIQTPHDWHTQPSSCLNITLAHTFLSVYLSKCYCKFVLP